MKQKLLLHVCCAPCGTHPIKLLRDSFDMTLLFYGPNIHPQEEYNKRLESARLLSETLKVDLVESEYDPDNWFLLVYGLEDEPEGGARCKICYKMRLEKTARYAKVNGFSCFGATLTLSPHKPANVINPIGELIGRQNKILFLQEDFKKKEGFKKSCELSKEYGLYRQKYCGCKYSMTNEIHK